jgi:hypothetical protein
MGESVRETEVFKEEMKRKFCMSDIEAISLYLSIEVKHT